MSTFGDIERTFASVYEYRWAIGAATLVFIAAVLAFAYWRGWHRIIIRHKVGFGVAAVPLLAITIWLGWSLGSPLFTNVTVEEQFPFALDAVVPEGMEREDVEMAMAGMAMVDDPNMEEAMPRSSAIDVASAMSSGNAVVVMTAEEIKALAEGYEMVADAGMDAEDAGMDAEMVEKGAQMLEPVVMAVVAPESGVRAVKQGDFKDADSFHRGSGQAIIYTTPEGGHLLRLENLEVTNGPALHVVLSPHEDPTRSNEVLQEGYSDLGDLKGNRGNQNYTIPAAVDLSVIKSVVIYCKPFAVVFSVATLQGT